MSWIKRNLFFVIGSVVALVLMGLAGFFLYSKWSLNNQVLGNLNADYDELKRLNGQKPHPGSGGVDNIKIAKEQREQVLAVLKKTHQYFEPVQRIPDLPKITDRDFSAALSQTIEQLRIQATNSSVSLPPDNYNFSFTSQKNKISFAPGSVDRLAVQLGEIKMLCQILFDAKVNALDNLRRERVSQDDSFGLQTDYISERTTSNSLAVLTPYEITFRSFSSELATVLAGFASSPHALLVKTINVEAAPPAPASEQSVPLAAQQVYIQQPVVNPMQEEMERQQREAQAAAAFRARYGNVGGGQPLGGIQYRGLGSSAPQPGYAPSVAVQPGVSPTGKGGLPTVLDEKLLKITLSVYLLKPVPTK